MKLSTEIQNVQSNVATSGVFKIAATNKAFEILSSGLYSDKPKAIVRELSTNAKDAQVAVGNSDKPFDVHLPTFAEPWFFIRDYGTGLSDADIKSIYTTYFESNKTDSNDFNGCLGLGSKSPFSYTDQFNVISFFNGVKRIYNCYLDETGLPNISEMASENSNAANGLEIKFPVAQKDFSSFTGAAQQVYAWFEVKPNVTGNYNPIEFKFVKRDKNWGMPDYNAGYPIYNAQLVMGNVAYPIYTADFNKNIKDRFTKEEISLLERNIVLFVDIGEADFAASREKLQYTDKTVTTIKKYISKIKDQVLTQLKNEVSAAKNLWEARETFGSFLVTNSISDLVINENVEWNGKKVRPKLLAVNKEAKTVAKIMRFFEHYSYKAGKNLIKMEEVTSLNIHKGQTIWVNNLKKNGVPFFREHIALNGIKEAYLIAEAKEVDFTEYCIRNGLDTLPTTDTLKCTVVKAVKKKTAKVLELTGIFYNAKDAFKEATIDLDQGGLYIDVFGFNWTTKGIDCVNGETYHHPQYLEKLIKSAKVLDPNIKSSQIIGFRKNQEFDSSLWKPLGESLTAEVENYKAKNMEKLYLHTIKERLNDDYGLFDGIKNYLVGKSDAAKYAKIKDSVSADGALGKLYTINDKLEIPISFDDKMKALVDSFNIKVELPDEYKALEKEYRDMLDNLFKVYPMLEFVNHWQVMNKPSLIIDYVNLIDGK